MAFHPLMEKKSVVFGSKVIMSKGAHLYAPFLPNWMGNKFGLLNMLRIMEHIIFVFAFLINTVEIIQSRMSPGIVHFK